MQGVVIKAYFESSLFLSFIWCFDQSVHVRTSWCSDFLIKMIDVYAMNPFNNKEIDFMVSIIYYKQCP